jgi:hypothetical protein
MYMILAQRKADNIILTSFPIISIPLHIISDSSRSRLAVLIGPLWVCPYHIPVPYSASNGTTANLNESSRRCIQADKAFVPNLY